MGMDPLRARVVQVFREVFDDPGLVVSADTTPADVRGWDSLGTVSLLYAIEAAFGVEITDDEVAGLTTVGAIEEYLVARAPG